MRSIRTIALDNVLKKHEANKRMAELMLTSALDYPDINQLYKRCRELQYNIAKLQYQNKDTSASKQELAKLKLDLYAALNKHGIDKSSLKTKYNCSICHDQGIVDGKDCVCLKQEISNYLLSISGVNKQSLPSFEDTYFKIFGDNEKQAKQIYALMNKYCDQPSKSIVTISGDVGVGKTHLIECMVNKCIDTGKYVIYATATSLNTDMLKYHTSPMAEKAQHLDKYFDCDILFIDDLGTESILKNVTNEYLYQIISERMRQGKNTIITTNLTLQQIIDTYDERIFSRIANQNMCMLISMQGKDLRQVKS